MANVQYSYGQVGQQPVYGSPAQPVQLVVNTPQPVIQPQQALNDGYKTPANKSAAYGLAVTILVIGVLCMIFQIVASSLYFEADGYLASTDGYVWTGLWVGAWFVLSGVVGILSAKKNSRGLLIGFMVLNILSCVIFTWVLLGMAATSLGIINRCSDVFLWYSYSSYSVNRCEGPERAAMGMNSLLIIAAVALFIICLTASIIGCSALCVTTGQVIRTGGVVTGAPYYTQYANTGQVQITTQYTTQYPQQSPYPQQTQQQLLYNNAYQHTQQVPPYTPQDQGASAPYTPPTSSAPQYTEKANN